MGNMGWQNESQLEWKHNNLLEKVEHAPEKINGFPNDWGSTRRCSTTRHRGCTPDPAGFDRLWRATSGTLLPAVAVVVDFGESDTHPFFAHALANAASAAFARAMT